MSDNDPPIPLSAQLVWAELRLDEFYAEFERGGRQKDSVAAGQIEMLSALVCTLRDHKEAVRLLRTWLRSWKNEDPGVPLPLTELLLERLEGVV